MSNSANVIEVPKANGMPLDRWTAYMDCTAIQNDLRKGEYYIATRDGMSVIVITKEDD